VAGHRIRLLKRGARCSRSSCADTTKSCLPT
jgi:hypothetical protein